MNKNTKKSGVGVVVGRFQTPQLHDAHIDLIKKALEHEHTIVFIGCASVPATKKNPLDFFTRKTMIEKCFPNQYFHILQINDHPSDIEWSKNLDKMIELIVGSRRSVTLYDGRDGFSRYYHGNNHIEYVNELKDVSATEIRKSVNHRETEDFRAGVIYGINQQYDRVSPAVDIAYFKIEDTNLFLLMGEKSHSPGVLRFPGGMVDIDDIAYEATAQRELAEEANVAIDLTRFVYVCSAHVNDWRATPDSVYKTTLFTAQYQLGDNEPVAGDDLSKIHWINYHDLITSLIMQDKKFQVANEHKKLLEALNAFLFQKGIITIQQQESKQNSEVEVL